MNFGYRSGIDVPDGRVLTPRDAALENGGLSEAGDFLFGPPRVSDAAILLGTTDPACAALSPNDPAGRD